MQLAYIIILVTWQALQGAGSPTNPTYAQFSLVPRHTDLPYTSSSLLTTSEMMTHRSVNPTTDHSRLPGINACLATGYALQYVTFVITTRLVSRHLLSIIHYTYHSHKQAHLHANQCQLACQSMFLWVLYLGTLSEKQGRTFTLNERRLVYPNLLKARVYVRTLI